MPRSVRQHPVASAEPSKMPSVRGLISLRLLGAWLADNVLGALRSSWNQAPSQVALAPPSILESAACIVQLPNYNATAPYVFVSSPHVRNTHHDFDSLDIADQKRHWEVSFCDRLL